MDSADQAPRLCSACQSFYGGPATNFFCSSCFKKQPVVTADCVAAATAEEIKSPEEEAKKQVRLLVTVDGHRQVLAMPEEGWPGDEPVQVWVRVLPQAPPRGVP